METLRSASEWDVVNLVIQVLTQELHVFLIGLQVNLDYQVIIITLFSKI